MVNLKMKKWMPNIWNNWLIINGQILINNIQTKEVRKNTIQRNYENK